MAGLTSCKFKLGLPMSPALSFTNVAMQNATISGEKDKFLNLNHYRHNAKITIYSKYIHIFEQGNRQRQIFMMVVAEKETDLFREMTPFLDYEIMIE